METGLLRWAFEIPVTEPGGFSSRGVYVGRVLPGPLFSKFDNIGVLER